MECTVLFTEFKAWWDRITEAEYESVKWQRGTRTAGAILFPG